MCGRSSALLHNPPIKKQKYYEESLMIIIPARIMKMAANFSTEYDSLSNATPSMAPITTDTSRRHTTSPTFVPGISNT